LPAESGLPAGKERVRLLFPGAEPLCAGGNTGPSGPPGKRKTSRAGGRGTHKTPPVHGEAESESALPVPAECGQPSRIWLILSREASQWPTRRASHPIPCAAQAARAGIYWLRFYT